MYMMISIPVIDELYDEVFHALHSLVAKSDVSVDLSYATHEAARDFHPLTRGGREPLLRGHTERRHAE